MLFLPFRSVNSDRFFSSSPNSVLKSDKNITYNAHDSQPKFTSSLQRKSVKNSLKQGEKAIYILMTSFDFIFNTHS